MAYEQRMIRSEEMAWTVIMASLRQDSDGLHDLVEELDLETARDVVYVLAAAVADQYARAAFRAGKTTGRLLDELTFMAIERRFADSPTYER
jgi:hypothetical protein